MSRRRGAASVAGTLAGAGLAAGAALAAYRALRQRPPGGADRWTRTNHRGEPVTLLEGPALAAGAAVAAALTPGTPPRVRAALIAAGLGAAAFGAYDDLAGNRDRRGFRGHLGALAQGELTTGAVKIGGIGATGLTASALLGGDAADVVVNAGLVAGSANLANLFDLRPGRAVKAALAGGALVAAGGALTGAAAGTAAVGEARQSGRLGAVRILAAPAGAAVALLAEDLGERAMLGDAGANALGAMLGVAAAASLPRRARIAALAGIVALTAASEKVSFTAVIERTPALRWADMLGRRPMSVQPAAVAPLSPAQPAADAESGAGRAEAAGAADAEAGAATAAAPG